MQILIVKTSALGDIIHSFEVLSYIKAVDPTAEIDWVVEKQGSALVEAHPHVRRAIVVDTKRWRKEFYLGRLISVREEVRKQKYDVVFDLQGNCKSALFTFMARASQKWGYGRKTAREWPNTLVTRHHVDPPKGQNIRDDHLFLVGKYFGKDVVGEPVVLNSEEVPDYGSNVALICPGSAWRNKMVTEEAMIDFLKKVEGYKYVFVWGNDSEKGIAEHLQSNFPNSEVAPRLSLPGLQRLMSQVALVVAMDSMPLHLCGTTKTPSFSVFGPSYGNKYAPSGPNHHHLQGSCPYGREFITRCSILRKCPTAACIRGLTGDQIYDSFANMNLK